MSVTIPLVHRPFCGSVAASPLDVGLRLRWAAALAAAIVLLVPTWPGLALGLVALLAPDVPLLLPRAWASGGRLRPWVVPAYNATHAVVGPVVVAAVGLGVVGLGAGTELLGVAAGWLAHVAVDRVLGYDLRDGNGDVRR